MPATDTIDILDHLEPAPARPRRGLRIALALIGLLVLGSLMAMLLVWRHADASTAAPRGEHHRTLVLGVMSAQNLIQSQQLAGAARPDQSAVAAAGALGTPGIPTEVPRVSTDVLSFGPGEIVTRSVIESDGYTTTTLMRAQQQGGNQSVTGCVERSDILDETCSQATDLAGYVR